MAKLSLQQSRERGCHPPNRVLSKDVLGAEFDPWHLQSKHFSCSGELSSRLYAALPPLTLFVITPRAENVHDFSAGSILEVLPAPPTGRGRNLSAAAHKNETLHVMA